MYVILVCKVCAISKYVGGSIFGCQNSHEGMFISTKQITVYNNNMHIM